MTAEYGNLDLTTGTFGVYNSFIYSPWLPREGLEGTGLYSASYPSGELEVSFYGKVVPEPNYLIKKQAKPPNLAFTPTRALIILL